MHLLEKPLFVSLFGWLVVCFFVCWFVCFPGDCLALKGGSGFVDVKLRGPVAVDAVTLEHIPKAISYNIATAPRRFRLRGSLWRSPERESGKVWIRQKPLA